ncbi:hypothetical protein D3C80_761070 [compost metagenome]
MPNTTAAVRALITARLATNRLCATPVQKMPSRAIHSQSMVATPARSGAANGSRHKPTTRFCHSAACTAGRRPEPARLVSDSRENSSPDSKDQSRPPVASLARSNAGVTSTRPMLTSNTSKASLRRMRSRNSRPSRITVKAGKLAKPRVAMATPATFTAMKKLTQCPASSTPPSSRRRASWPLRRCQPGPARLANSARASTAKAARPKTMIAGLALAASLPKTPVRPKNSAPMCRAPRAVRWFMGGPCSRSLLAVPASSRACPLPQVLHRFRSLCSTCGSGFTRERAGTGKVYRHRQRRSVARLASIVARLSPQCQRRTPERPQHRRRKRTLRAVPHLRRNLPHR